MLYNNVFFANLKFNIIKNFADLTKRELFSLSILFILVIIFGIKPTVLSILFDRFSI